MIPIAHLSQFSDQRMTIEGRQARSLALPGPHPVLSRRGVVPEIKNAVNLLNVPPGRMALRLPGKDSRART
jgi:hypothetical protein